MQRFPLSVVLAAFSSLVTKLGAPNVDMVEKLGVNLILHMLNGMMLKNQKRMRRGEYAN